MFLSCRAQMLVSANSGPASRATSSLPVFHPRTSSWPGEDMVCRLLRWGQSTCCKSLQDFGFSYRHNKSLQAEQDLCLDVACSSFTAGSPSALAALQDLNCTLACTAGSDPHFLSCAL